MISAELNIVRADTPDRLEQARELIVQYAAALRFDLEFQGFSQEMTTLPGVYSPPAGGLFLAKVGDRFVGCAALRDLGDAICEMKRLYVMPAFRGEDIGRRLAQAVIDEACALGYRRMRLDTLASMEAANALYRSLGFIPIAPYYPNPIRETRYYELALAPIPAVSG